MAGAEVPAFGVGGAADLVFGGDGDFASGDDAGLGGRAAHVEGQQVRPPQLPPGQCRTDHPGGGAGFHRHGRHPQPLGDVEHAARRSHHVQFRQSQRSGRGGQALQIPGQQRPDIGADRAGAGALEFADFRQHIAGQEHAHVRQGGAQNRADPSFMGIVQKREEARHGDRLQARRPNRRDDGCELRFHQRRDHLALRIDPFGDFEPVPPRHQHGGPVLEQVIQIRPRGPPQFQDIAKSPCGDEPGPSTLLFQQRVGHHRGGMRQQRDIRRRDAILRQPGLDARDHRLPEIARRGQHLGDADPARRLIDQRHVGEGAADIDANPPRHAEAPA